MRIVIGRRFDLPTGLSVASEFWKAAWNEKQRRFSTGVRITHAHGYIPSDVEDLNDQLGHAEAIVRDIFRTHQLTSRLENIPINGMQIKAEFHARLTGKPCPSVETQIDVLSAFDRYIERAGMKPSHKANLILTKGKVNAFVEATGISKAVSKINHNWLHRFARFYTEPRGTESTILSATTMHSHLNRIRYVLNDLDDEFELSRSLNRQVKLISATPVIKPTLTPNEIESLLHLQLKTPSQMRARDWFVIQCWTGLRVSDLMKLSMSDVYEIDDKPRIRLYQNKTSGLIDIPLHPNVVDVIKRLDGLPDAMERTHYGKQIKQICRAAGFDEVIVGDRCTPYKKRGRYPRWQLISSHSARRSAATNLIRLGVNMDVVCLLTGHTSTDQLRQYIQLTPREKTRQLDEALLKAV